MKTKIVIVVLLLAIVGIWNHRGVAPLQVEGVTDDGRRYFCIYELNEGETHEQVEDQVTSSR